MTIYVITHKAINSDYPINYQKMLVGAFNKKHGDNTYVYDDQGDNISWKNPNYCELTGLYSIWKNSQDDIVGLVHYRRFFTKNRFSVSTKYFYDNKTIEKIFKCKDIIVGERVYSNTQNIKCDYSTFHYAKDWDTLKEVIRKYYPSYYSDFLMIEEQNWFYPYNMLIGQKQLVDDYCEWLFNILSLVETSVDLNDYSKQQARIFGFMSERLLALWIIHNNINAFEAPVIQLDSRFRYRVRRGLEKLLKRRVKL